MNTAGPTHNNEILQAFFDTAPIAIAVLRIPYGPEGAAADFEILQLNPYAQRVTGLSSASVNGKRCREVFPAAVVNSMLHRFAAVAVTGAAADFDQCWEIEGMRHWFHLIAVKQGDVLVVTAADISAQKTAELEAAAAQAVQTQQLSQARHALLQQLVTVQEDERRRIARELHDSLGQFLSALNLRMWMVEQTMDMSAEIMEDMRQLHQLVGEVERELNRLTMELRPPALDDFGLPEAIRRYAEEWGRTTGIPVDVYASVAEGERLEFMAEIAVYRIVQEALTNVLKHARASAVSIVLERQRSDLRLVVEDNGGGFDLQAARGGGRLGLVGMRERAALAGGWMEIETAPNAGTTLYVQIPVQREEGA